MKFISPFLKTVLYPTLSTAGLFHRSGKGLAIVTYHGLLPEGYVSQDQILDGNLISADALRQQIRLLKKHYQIVPPEDVLAWCKGESRLPARAVLLTCDDGLLNCLTDMLPVLREEEVPCLFFVTGASAGEMRRLLWYEELFFLFQRAPAGEFEISSSGEVLKGELGSRDQRRSIWWAAVKRLSRLDADARDMFLDVARNRLVLNRETPPDLLKSTLCRRFGLMTVAELRQVAASGMSIGAHTLSHPMLSQAPSRVAYAEIAESRSRLQEALKMDVWAFAYPFGNAESVTPEVLAMPREAGFSAGFLNFGGGLGAPLPEFALPRVHVTSDMSLSELDAHVSGFHAWVQMKAHRTPAAIEVARA